MKFVIARQELIHHINRAINIVSSKPTIPILSNFLMETTKQGLVLTATDLTVGIRCFTEAKVLQEGSTTVPAKRFAQLIRELTANNLEITVHPNEIIEIRADSSSFKMHGMNKSEFPALPDLNGAGQFKIKQSELKEMFFRTSFAVSREENRYVLTGVYMQISNGIATFIGTDGRRLAKAYSVVSIDPSFSGEYIIPLKAVEEIVKNLDGQEDSECTVYLMNDKIAIEASHTTLVTKLLSGEYPDVSRVIPGNPEKQLTLHREELSTLLRQVSLFTNESAYSVRFVFNEGELRLMANTSDIGEGRVSMPVNFHGPQMEIAFNPAFFLDILRHSKQETVSMGVIDPYNPSVITDHDPANTSSTGPRSLFVLMPMRLADE